LISLNISIHQRTRLVNSLIFISFGFHFYDGFLKVITLTVVHFESQQASVVNTPIGPWQDLESVGKALVNEGVDNA
jgi:hypothetical protein